MKSSLLLLAIFAAACLETPSTPADAGVVGPPDGGSAETCGTTRALRDEFDVLGPVWEGWGDASGFTDGGRRQMYAASGAEGGLNTTWTFLADGGEVVLQLLNLGVGADGSFYLQLVDVDDNAVSLVMAGSTLSLQLFVDGNMTSPDAIDWEPDMLWWRLRDEGGQLVWGVSTNGQDWDDHEPIENPLSGLVGLLLGLAGGSVQSVVEIDAINPESTELECPAASLVDEFSGLSFRWAKTETPGCAVTTPGDLRIAYDESDFCGIYTVERFDLRGGAMAIDVEDAGDCDLAVGFGVDLGDWSAEMECYNDGTGAKLRAGLYGDGAPGELANVTYSASEHRLWQIGNEAGSGTLTLSVATAEGGWQTLGSTPVDDEQLMAAGVNFLVKDSTPDGTMDEVILDRLNLVP